MAGRAVSVLEAKDRSMRGRGGDEAIGENAGEEGPGGKEGPEEEEGPGGEKGQGREEASSSSFLRLSRASWTACWRIFCLSASRK